MGILLRCMYSLFMTLESAIYIYLVLSPYNKRRNYREETARRY